ncbi:fibronectin type III domain-containing protein [Gemmobacter sp.]|uniref:fibronectin type III domain-containing protein n=1 Tax=Gemmobacter sp. TaxID=1898957 RepID=UPI002AFE03F5|nr:fibronectin type III domain-containing protein [Gemmobacter sp.]
MPQVIATSVAGWLAGAGIGAGIAIGTTTWAMIYAQLGVSVLFSAVAKRMAKRGMSGSDSQIDVDQPASVVIKRHAYGWGRIEGTPAAIIVRDGVSYAVWIVSSRPSHEIETIEFDNRVLTLTGDLLDYATGATATDSVFGGHVKVWAGLGDQAGIPAQILAEVGDPTATDDADFWDTDRWQGRTVIWARMAKGDPASAGQRWQRMPPVLRVTGKWTRVWDPRDPAQDADDPATWEWSDNQALCLIDALRFNPIAQLPVSLLHMPSLLRQADVADQAVALKAGGTEPRYRVGGRILYDPSTELYQALSPLDVAGGGGLVQIGGQIGYQPGEYLAPSDTIDDVLREAPLAFTAQVRGRDLPRAIRAVYPNPGGGWEDASLIPIAVPGAGGWTGGDDRVEDLALPMVPWPHQANRLAQIRARQLGCQKRIKGVLFPRHFNLVAGANVTLSRPRPTDPRAGVYQITKIEPGYWMGADAERAPFRQPFEAREITADVYAWVAATDEQDIPVATVTQPDLALEEPTIGSLTAVGTYSGPELVVALAEGADNRTYGAVYALQYRIAGDDSWVALAAIQPFWAFEPGDVTSITGRIPGVLPETDYEVRVRAEGQGRVSDWVTGTITTPEFFLIIDAGIGP